MDAKIDTYQLTWNTLSGQGTIQLVILDTKETIDVTFHTASEFHIVVSILQNEDPVYWNDTNNTIYTGTSYVFQEFIDTDTL
ncbi:hypothetical protein ACWX0P_29530 [Vibrio mediterranei]